MGPIDELAVAITFRESAGVEHQARPPERDLILYGHGHQEHDLFTE
jgi:hypothetical protein